MKFWRHPKLDEKRRRASYFLFVQYPNDLLPVVPQQELEPSLLDEHLETISRIVEQALQVNLADVASAMPDAMDAEYVLTWPGEHYRLLAGLAAYLRPSLAVEIGTFRGAAAMTLGRYAEQVVTFDITPLSEIGNSIPNLVQRCPNIRQVIANLEDEVEWQTHTPLFRDADLVFVDGPKDGSFEGAVVPRILAEMKPGSIMVLDDIRFAAMSVLWRDGITYPRIDLGNLGHFSGTGIVFR